MTKVRLLQEATEKRWTIYVMIKKIIDFALLIISTMFVSASASAETCISLFNNGLYEEALPLCLQEKDNFRLGFIYGQLKDCQNMKKYYDLSHGPTAKGNLGINLLYGTSGCEKNVQSGIAYLKQGLEGNKLGFANILGDYYRTAGDVKMAKSYYLKSINLKYGSDWDMVRARESYDELIKLLNEEELKKFSLEKINVPENATDWEKELASKAINVLKSILNVDEKLALLLSITKSNDKYKCEIGESLYTSDFEGLVAELTKQNKTKVFTSRLCKGDKEYFLGKTFENGLGNKEDFQEAYRLYLIAGANGNKYAKAARDKIRDQLTPEQVQEAICLADYGLEPSYFAMVRCKF